MRKSKGVFCFSFLILLILTITPGISQNYDININAYTNYGPIFNVFEEMVDGKIKSPQLTIQIQKAYHGARLNQWKLTLKLADDHKLTSNPNYSIGAQYAQVSLNNESTSGAPDVNPPNTPFTMSKYDEVTLVESTVPFTAQQYIGRTLSYNLFIEGGYHLLVSPNGRYDANYEIRLYGRNNGNQPYQLVASNFYGAQSIFQINYEGNHGVQEVTLQNGANQFNFAFLDANDYANGKSIEIQNGLRVRAYDTYELTIKSSNAEFVSQTTSATIPISVLKAEASINGSQQDISFLGPVTLSTSDQAIISRTDTWPQLLEYNIRLFIPPNAIQLPVEEATYTAYIYFTIAPY